MFDYAFFHHSIQSREIPFSLFLPALTYHAPPPGGRLPQLHYAFLLVENNAKALLIEREREMESQTDR